MSTVSVNTRRSFKITYLWLTPGLLTFLVFSKHLAWVITMANGKKVRSIALRDTRDSNSSFQREAHTCTRSKSFICWYVMKIRLLRMHDGFSSE